MRNIGLTVTAALFGFLLLCGIAPAQVATRTWTEYVLGRWVTQPVKKLREDEAWSKQGHMPWRAEPAVTASVLGANLMPPLADKPIGGGETQNGSWLQYSLKTPTTEITFEVVAEKGDAVDVAVKVNGVTSATIHLERPFGYWWYITSVATPKGTVSRPTTAPVRWVSLRRALVRQGFEITWVAGKRSIAVTKGGALCMEVKVGDPAVRLGGRPLRLDTAPKFVKGRVLIPEYLVADLLSQDARIHASLRK
jgi:hypothetical protein